jgi:SAM-dependent methyltransferase
MAAERSDAAALAGIYAANQQYWDSLVSVHIAPEGYELIGLRNGRGELGPLVEAELAQLAGSLSGQRVIHLQCHFGADTLSMAQRDAVVVGVDFSPTAIAAARSLAAELGLERRARFVECNLYDAPGAVGEAGTFDLAFVTWGTICWLPDIEAWAQIVAGFLRPGGRLYFAEGHPAAFVFDDMVPGDGKHPGWFAPYFEPGPLEIDEPTDYANPSAQLSVTRSFSWTHPLGSVVMALIEAGLVIRFIHEHDGVPWPMFQSLVRGKDGMFRWPDRPWLPLSYSIGAEKPAGT